MVASGIPEIDELLAAIRDRPTGTLPPDVEARLRGFAERASTLTGTERTILQYYMDGYTVKDIPGAGVYQRQHGQDPQSQPLPQAGGGLL